MKSVLILLVAVVAGTSAQFCCFPDAFQIDLGIIVGSVEEGRGESIDILSKMAFDYTNKRAAEVFSYTEGGVGVYFQITLDFKKRLGYYISPDTSTCIVMDLPDGNMTHCIPGIAKPSGSTYLGDNKLTQVSYSYNYDQDPEKSGKVFLSVSKENCIPLSAVALGDSADGSAMMSAGFSGYVKGISDPDRIFDVPSYCPERASKGKNPKLFKHHLNLLFL